MFMLEVTWWSQRGLWHLMFAGVFERYPELRWVNTETGTAWLPDTLTKLDSFYDRMKYSKYGSESIFGGMAVEGDVTQAQRVLAAPVLHRGQLPTAVRGRNVPR